MVSIAVHGIQGRQRIRVAGAALTGLLLCSVRLHQTVVTDSARIRAVFERAGF
jgi:hypothetical protein